MSDVNTESKTQPNAIPDGVKRLEDTLAIVDAANKLSESLKHPAASKTVQYAAAIELLVQLNEHSDILKAYLPENWFYWFVSAIPVGIVILRFISTGSLSMSAPMFGGKK